MPFNVVLRTDLSMADLLEKKAAGQPVTKTPHVGNWYPCNLAVAALGIRMLVIDRNYGRKDKNFHPHCVIIGGKRHFIANSDLLASHARVDTNGLPRVAAEFFPLHGALRTGHMTAIKRALPSVDAQTLTEWLSQRESLVNYLVEATAFEFVRLWERRVDLAGNIIREPLRSVRDLWTYGIYGVNNPSSGWITPNVVNIALCESIIAMEAGVEETYHLSGPDMHRYISGYLELLHALHALFKRKDSSLPATMTMNLVPVADFRFTVPKKRQTKLDALVEDYRCHQSWRKKWQEILSPTPEPGQMKPLIIQKNAERIKIRDELCASLAECREILYDISEGNFVSQYDLLADTDELYIHPWAMTTTMNGLSEAVNFLSRVWAQ
jgi:hypothetical protein